MPYQNKYWCFTKQVSSNANDSHAEYLNVQTNIDVKYAVWQLEGAGTTGQNHYQGYIEMKKAKTLTAMKKILPGAHLEQRKGTATEAKDYCTKEDTAISGPWEFGEFEEPAPGKRNDLLECKQMIDDGIPEKELIDEHFGSWCRNGKAFKEYRRMISPVRKWKSQVIVLWGETGNGKSRWAFNNTVDAYHAYDGKWFDDYNGYADVIFDDFTGWIEYNKFLRMLDEYPCKVEMKGGVLNWAPRRIVITSNKPPWEWYDFSKVRGTRDAMDRRLDHVFTFTALPCAHAIETYHYRDLINKINGKDVYPTPPPWEENPEAVVEPKPIPGPIVEEPTYIAASDLPRNKITTSNNNDVVSPTLNSPSRDTPLPRSSYPPVHSAFLRTPLHNNFLIPYTGHSPLVPVLARTGLSDMFEAGNQHQVAIAEGAWNDDQVLRGVTPHDVITISDNDSIESIVTDSTTEEDDEADIASTMELLSAKVRKLKRKNPFIDDEAKSE